MTTHSEVVVHTEGEFTIVRWKFWGFRCESVSTSWLVKQGDKTLHTCDRLRDAKDYLSRWCVAPLRERLCTPVTVQQAAALLA